MSFGCFSHMFFDELREIGITKAAASVEKTV
jgi:hypothetical protein